MAPGVDNAEAGLEATLSSLETAVYRSLVGVVEACEQTASHADAAGLLPLAIRARLLAADVRSRQGQAEQARDEQHGLRERARPWPTLVRRASMYLASTCDRLGLRVESMGCIEDSVSADPHADTPAWHAEALMVAALLSASHRGADFALVERAMAAVRAACGPVQISVSAANFAEVASECGELALAGYYADEAEATMRRHPECAAALSWESVARARLVNGELAAAEHAMRESLRLEEQFGCCDVNGDPWLSQAEVMLARGDAEQAQAALEHPRRLQRGGPSTWTGTRELRVRAEVRAALGLWEQAYRCMLDYVAAYERARSVEGDRAAARSAAAVAVDDARRQAQHFEHLALTDALTGLPNRRHAERWLAEQAGRGALCVAIADLDHFKRINDTHSHDAGDLVLRRFGALLQDMFRDAPATLAARLGGEEFLLAWAGDTTPDAALRNCQALQERLRGISFADILGPLPATVTVSIGLNCAAGPADPGALLRQADRCLYAAKRAGRDRVAMGSAVASARSEG